MRRGDIWTVACGRDYAGKPRPVAIVQDDSFDATASITVCAFTTDKTEVASVPPAGLDPRSVTVAAPSPQQQAGKDFQPRMHTDAER